MSQEAQEPRNQIVTAAVTPQEKRYVELVATIEKRSASDLIRAALADVFARGAEYADTVGALRGANAA